MIHIHPLGNPDGIGLIDYINFGIMHYLARIAVPFFFVASGFFLFKKTSLTNFSFEPIKKYALRLFKLYIIWTLIYFPLSLWKIFKDERGILKTVKSYIRDCIFTGSFIHLWYLNAAIFAVLLIAFLLYKKISPKKMVLAAFVIYVFGLFGDSWSGFIMPLRELTPFLWSFLKLIQKFIVTTRDGLFDGFLFVGIGVLFAFYRFNISKKKAFIGFVISILLMLGEVFLLHYFYTPRGRNIYLFLVPATFFLFAFVSQVDLPNNDIYKKLRTLSMIIYYSHYWIIYIVRKILKIIYEPLAQTCLVFVFTLIITIIGSLIVMKLSEYPKFNWLKKLYT